MNPTWLDFASFLAAGALGGIIYWSYGERRLILARVKSVLRGR